KLADKTEPNPSPRHLPRQASPDYKPWCGPPPITLGAFFRRHPSGGIPALFRGRRVAYSFNARVAIRQACDILGLKAGDGVLVPGWNCGSEVDPLLDAGLELSLYPVNRSGAIDPDAVARMIGPKTRAIYFTHYFGL